MRILIVAPAHPSLADVAREAAAVSNAHPGSRLLQGRVSERDLAAEVTCNCFDMLWVASHAGPDGILLSDSTLAPDVLASYVDTAGAELVFLNTCTGIEIAQMIVDTTRASVIATIGDVTDVTAARVGHLFASQLATGMDVRAAYEASKPKGSFNYVYLQNAEPGGTSKPARSRSGAKTKSTAKPGAAAKPAPAPAARPAKAASGKKPGGQPGNLNAFKHGFYSRAFQWHERTDIDDLVIGGLDDEIHMLRVNMRRFMQLAEGVEDLDRAARVLDVLGMSATRLASMLKVQRFIEPAQGEGDVARAIGDALSAVVREFQIGL